MGSRPPQIHASALSPQEYEAYSMILLDFDKKLFQDSEIEVIQVWDYLKSWLSGIDAVKRESETHPISLSQAPIASKPSNNPFLSSDWANRRNSILTPPSSLPSPTSPLSPKPLILTKAHPPSQSQTLASARPGPPISLPVSSSSTQSPPDIPSRRPNLPPPRRPSNNSTATQRSVSASTPSSSQSTILAPSPSSAPPLPIRRSVSLHHPSPGAPSTPAQAHSTTQLSRASTVKSRPPPPLPPSKATKPPMMARTSSSNAHIGLEDSLDLRKSTESETTSASATTGNRSRKSSLSLMGISVGGGTGSKNRSRSNSSASNPPKPPPSEYTYAPIASSFLSSSSTSLVDSAPTSTPQAAKTTFESFAAGSVVLPPRPCQPLPPPSHPDCRKSPHVNSTSSTGTTLRNPTLSSTSPSNRSKIRTSLDPFASPNAAPLSKHHSTSSTIVEGASQRVREVLETFGGGGARRSRKFSNDGETDVERREENDGLIRPEEDGFEDDGGDTEDEDEIGINRETESSETEDEEEMGENSSARGEKRERMKEVEREARRRDEQGQWIQLS
ncbi:hypothetical protein JCM3765_007220 [Sporobolomyces pararoseus]